MYARQYFNGSEPLKGQWRINLDILSWVPAEDVLLAYKRMQQGAIGGRNKLPGQKTCEVACFVWEQDRLNEYKRLPWPELCRRWNASNGDTAFKKWRGFRASFKRGESAVKEINYEC
jgi:hypothetical protein